MASNHLKTRNRIFQAACLLFSEEGYSKVSMRMIADHAQARHGSIYYHFESKESLYTEVFRSAYDIENLLTYDILVQREPTILDSPVGKSYAIQRVVGDYFRRHFNIPDEWKRKLIFRELFEQSPLFLKLLDDVLKIEVDKMIEFYYLLNPDGSKKEAYYWSHLPDTQALFYMLTESTIVNYYDQPFFEELGRHVMKTTTRTMIMLLDLPVPEMLR